MSLFITFIKKHIQKQISHQQSKDTGLALLLLFLIIGLFTRQPVYFELSLITLLLVMIVPIMFKPLGFIWFSLSSLVGSIMSKVMLTVIFFILIVPVGYIRKLMQVDNLKLLKFKKGDESVMIERNHTFTRSDLQRPY